jgi:hypothetical protein
VFGPRADWGGGGPAERVWNISSTPPTGSGNIEHHFSSSPRRPWDPLLVLVLTLVLVLVLASSPVLWEVDHATWEAEAEWSRSSNRKAAIVAVIADGTRKADLSLPPPTLPKSAGRREERDEMPEEAGADCGFLLCRTEGGA